MLQHRQRKYLNLPLFYVIEVELLKMRFSLLKVKQGHPISHKFQSLSRDQAAFDAHPANFYYHTIELYQTTACIFSNEMYIKKCRFASL